MTFRMLHILLFMVEMQQTLVEVSQILHQGNLKKKSFGGWGWRERSTNILCIMGNSNEKLIYISKLKQVLLSGLTGPKFSER